MKDIFETFKKDKLSDIKNMLDIGYYYNLKNDKLYLYDSNKYLRIFRSIKSSDALKLYLDFLLNNNMYNSIESKHLKNIFNFTIKSNITNNIDKYEPLFKDRGVLIEFLLHSKNITEDIIQTLNRLYIDNFLDIYIDHNNIKSFFNIYNIILKPRNVKLTYNILNRLVLSKIDLEFVEDLLKIDDIELYQKTIHDIMYSISSLPFNKIDDNLIDKLVKLFDENNISYENIDTEYFKIYSILNSIPNLYQHDLNNLDKYINKHFKTISKYNNLRLKSSLNLEHFFIFYKVDKKLAKKIIYENDDLNMIYQFNNVKYINEIIDKYSFESFIDLFEDYIYDNIFQIIQILVIDSIRDRLIYNNNSEEVIISIFKTIDNYFDEYKDNIKKIYKDIRFLNKDILKTKSLMYYRCVDKIKENFNDIVKYYIPIFNNNEEINNVKISITNIINDIKNCTDDRKKFYMIKDFKQYIDYIKSLDIDINHINKDL